MSDNPYLAPKATAPLVLPTGGRRVAGWIDAAASALFVVLFVLAQREAKLAAEEAVRLYGRNVDSGAFEHFVSVVYLAPSALLLALAASAFFLGWRFRRALHWLSWAWVVLPLALTIWSAVAA